MNIKLSLKQLASLFVQSAANEELPEPIRQFAAQLTVLTAHMERIEAKFGHEATKNEGLIAELAQLVNVVAARQPSAAPVAAPAPEGVDSDDSEENEAKAMAEQVMRDTEAEVAALAKAPSSPTAPVAPVASVASVEKTVTITPLRKNAGNANKKASAEDVS